MKKTDAFRTGPGEQKLAYNPQKAFSGAPWSGAGQVYPKARGGH